MLINTPSLLSLLLSLSIYTARLDDIAECKYTPSLSASSFSNYVLSACTLLLLFCCSFHFLNPLFTLPSPLFSFSSLFQNSLIHPKLSSFSPSSSSHLIIPLLPLLPSSLPVHDSFFYPIPSCPSFLTSSFPPYILSNCFPFSPAIYHRHYFFSVLTCPSSPAGR